MNYASQLNTLFFDMDETLITGANDKYAIDFIRTMHALIGDKIPFDEATTAHKNFRKYISKYNISEPEYWQVYGQNRMSIEEAKDKAVLKLFPDTVEALQGLSQWNYDMAIISRTNQEDTVKKVKEFGLKQYFSSVKGSDDITRKAENKLPQLLQAYAELYSLKSVDERNILVIGDSKDDLNTAFHARQTLNKPVQGILVDRDNSSEYEGAKVNNLLDIERYTR